MEEIKIENIANLDADLEQFECPGCKKKFYINELDMQELDEDVLDCPFCDIHGVPNIRLLKVTINKTFNK